MSTPDGPKAGPCTPWGMRHIDRAAQWHLEFANPRPLATPVGARGRLGLWGVDNELEQQILEQIGDSS